MKSFVVIGAGRFGGSVARELSEQGYDVMVIDESETRVQNMSKYVTHAVVADATDEEVLKSLGIRNMDVGVVSIGSDLSSSVLVTLILKNLGVKHILAKATNNMHAKILEKVGANKIVFPEKDMGIRVANSLSMSNILDYIELSPKYSVIEIEMPTSWIGKSIMELDIRAKYGINIVAIKKGKDIVVTPGPEYVFTNEDFPIVIGKNDDIRNI